MAKKSINKKNSISNKEYIQTLVDIKNQIQQSQVKSSLHKRQGKAITNFSRTLPAPHSDLASNL